MPSSSSNYNINSINQSSAHTLQLGSLYRSLVLKSDTNASNDSLDRITVSFSYDQNPTYKSKYDIAWQSKHIDVPSSSHGMISFITSFRKEWKCTRTKYEEDENASWFRSRVKSMKHVATKIKSVTDAFVQGKCTSIEASMAPLLTKELGLMCKITRIKPGVVRVVFHGKKTVSFNALERVLVHKAISQFISDTSKNAFKHTSTKLNGNKNASKPTSARQEINGLVNQADAVLKRILVLVEKHPELKHDREVASLWNYLSKKLECPCSVELVT